MKRAIILSVGDELVLGQTVDTNSAWISTQLASIGCAVKAHMTVGDDQSAIEGAIRAAIAAEVSVLIISGGIGPTPDDLTRQALAGVMNAPLQLSGEWLSEIERYFTARNRVMPRSNSIQAMIPRGANLIWNTCGTAAGIDAPIAKARVFVVPGVPSEMHAMITRDVLPKIKSSDAGGAVILSRTMHTFGLGESAIAEKLGELMNRARNPLVGTTVSDGVVSLRVNARFDSIEIAQREMDQTLALARDALGDLIYGENHETLQSAVGALLAEKRKTVATAESCTGGLLAKMLTDVSGSSAYFQIGFVTYSNAAKYERLGVSVEIINLNGAVSEPVVQLMAKHARRLAKADYALAISGIAGPTGGSPGKPVGTVCIALARSATEPPTARTFNFPGDRSWIRDRAAKMALNMLRYELIGQPLPV